MEWRAACATCSKRRPGACRSLVRQSAVSEQSGSLAAAPSGWEYLSGVAERLWVKRLLEVRHGFEVVRRELERHAVALFQADAVLARNAAAVRHARAQDVGAGGDRTLQLARTFLVEEDERMKIAVAGVKHVGDPQFVTAPDLIDFAQHVGKTRARYDAVLHVVVRTDPPHCS